MFVNIITPCSRPENLSKIADSIKLPPSDYQWIIVHDANELPDRSLLPTQAIHIAKRVKGSISGNGQRNTALNLLGDRPNTWIYFNDDDTVIHPELWGNVKANPTADFIHFQQAYPDGSIRIYSNTVAVTHIDSHNFIFKTKLLGDTRWILEDYCADGHFANEIYKKANNPLYISTVLSTYNSLR